MSGERQLSPAELVARARALSDQLDAEGIPLGQQVAICGSIVTGALYCLEGDERLRHLAAHVESMQSVYRELMAPPRPRRRRADA